MNTPHDPTDDILELTDIVEEGDPGDTGLDFAMDTAVDARSLDEELDDLLRDTDATPKAAPRAETAKAPVTPFPQDSQDKPQASGQDSLQADLSDLDDLLGSLHDDAEPQTSLDMLLEEKSQGQAAAADDDTIDLDLDVPGLDTDDSSPDLLELTDDLLADIPDTVLVPPADSLAPTAGESPILPSPEGLELDLEATGFLSMTAGHTPPEPEREAPPATAEPVMAKPVVAEPVVAEPVVAFPAPAEPDTAEPLVPAVSQAEFEILSSRLDALEARPEPAAEIRPELILAALPATPDDLPLARALRESIMQNVEDRLAAAAPASGLADLLRKTEDLAGRLEAVESRPAPEFDLTPERMLAALPATADGLPLTRDLRDEILAHVDAKVSPMAAADDVAKLRRTVDAMQDQIDSMPEILAKLATTATPALQELENSVSTLRNLAQGLEQGMASMQTALAREETALAEMREGGERLREEVEALAARLETAPDAVALRADMEGYIRQQVPAVVGRIIREEIQALLKELGA